MTGVRPIADVAVPIERVLEAWPDLSAPVWWCGFALMVLGLLAPILVVDVPPLTDYPNHLARCFFLAFGARDPVMRRMFATRWAIIPNLGVDMILPPLMHLMPPLVAGRVVVALAVLLPSTGTIALSRVLFRRRSVWQLGAGFVAYNTMLLIGTLSFQLAVGVALWGAACWVALVRRHAVLGAMSGVVFGVAAFVCHLFGFVFYSLLIGCAELTAFHDRSLATKANRSAALRRGTALLGAVIVPMALYVASPFASTGGDLRWWGPAKKLVLLLVPIWCYSTTVSLLVASALAVMVLGWARGGRLQLTPLAWVAVPVMAVAYLALPAGAKGGFWIDTRVLVLLGFSVFALAAPRRLPARHALLAAGVLAVLFTGRMAYITWVWAGSRQDVADVRQVLQAVSPGSRLLVVDGDHDLDLQPLSAVQTARVTARGITSAYWHYGAFALIDRQAFWSDAFTLPGQQPVIALPPYDLSTDHGEKPPRSYQMLAAAATKPQAADPLDYLDAWPAKFDYVLLLAADAVPQAQTLAPAYLMPLAHNRMAALFKVKR